MSHVLGDNIDYTFRLSVKIYTDKYAWVYVINGFNQCYWLETAYVKAIQCMYVIMCP